MKTLQHKTALVTGGSRGIGAAIAKRLAKEGANVAITYQASAEKAAAVVKEIEALGVKGLAIQADSADPHAVTAAVDRTARELGGLDIIVNNAGIGLYKDITEFTIEDFDLVSAVNVRAVFAGSKAALAYMGRGGRIINIGSCQAERMPTPGGSLYAMSKSALVGLTKGMARDLGPKGITVNAVHPGPIDTDMNPANGPHADYERSIMAIPEFGTGEDIAAMVAYLAGPESSYVTGAGFVVDGGTNI
ncbi:SDR family NAD(P)-dependent oxidoreductase [Chitinophaga sp. GCM10012297]|uniref:3-oxoacyl-ACP reductase FabG n=1 Tax=Chitinophaga chungangae TaxID=2821488 RepID=A0ABS3YC62_9BACT|nr:3-oxoacyl-ACP reductase family protein [Chitinophaga chungangae]MBO9152263.1 3-oxoacyl-ACP reductase FabG [Chitinophaga chungangae]